MDPLPFNENLISWLADNRLEWVTAIMLFFTNLGSQEGYILIVVGLYWIFSKRKAFRITLVLLLSSMTNHILKIIIRNPRPFVVDNTYPERWAISNVEETALEFSTPSGHAQTGASFWLYLHLKFKGRISFVFMILMILMLGISRPYLGVHFLEDILIGWLVGILLVVLVTTIEEPMAKWWVSIPFRPKAISIVVVPLLIGLIAGVVSSYNVDGEPFTTFAGMFAGLILGFELESKQIGFEPDLSGYSLPSAVLTGLARYILGAVVTLAIFFGLDVVFSEISSDDSFVGFILRFIRYSALGLTAAYLVPWMFVRLKLSKTISMQAN